MTKIEYQDGTTEEYGYDEWQNCIYEKNRRDVVTRRTFTEDGHKIKEEFANGLAINYAYDGNGNCTKEWDNAGGCTRYRYDYLDRLIWVRDPLGREKTFIRDGRGNVLRESLLAKRTIPETAVPEIRSTYDANDHLLETIYPDGGIWKECVGFPGKSA